jgi:hypothetical protein
MTTFKSFPDLGRSFDKMRLMDRLNSLRPNGLYSDVIALAIMNKKPLQDICEWIMEQYFESPEDVLNTISEETICLIIKIYPKLCIEKQH